MKDDERLEHPPFPGELGKRIQDNVTKEQWQEWLQLQTMIINEMGINAMDPAHREYLRDKMEEHLFGDGVDAPEGYVPEKD